jgi:heptosyltransferase-2
MKALIVAPAWIGDAIMAQPLFARLHQRHPGLQLDALAPSWVAPVLARMPEIGEIIDNPFAHGELNLKARWQLGRELAKRHYDAAWILPNSLKSALLPMFAGIPRRVGFTGESRYGLVNVRHTLDKAALPLMVERFAQLAENPGAPLPRPVPYPFLRSTPENRQKSLADLGVERPQKLVAFCPGAEYGPAKRWPAVHFAALARALYERGYTVWLFGSGKDKAVAEEIAALAPGPIRNLCGTTSLSQAVDLLAMSDLVVCNDSGLMHVAAAVDRPIVALYGSSSPGFTPPLSDQADIVSLKLDCSPCFKRDCPLGHLDCLNRLTPEMVLAACLQRMTP